MTCSSRILVALAVGQMVTFGCTFQAAQPTNPEDPGPAPLVRDPNDCELACEKLTELECPEAASTPGKDRILGTADDGTCVDVCENTPILRPDCVKEISSCDQIDTCVSVGE